MITKKGEFVNEKNVKAISDHIIMFHFASL